MAREKNICHLIGQIKQLDRKFPILWGQAVHLLWWPCLTKDKQRNIFYAGLVRQTQNLQHLLQTKNRKFIDIPKFKPKLN